MDNTTAGVAIGTIFIILLVWLVIAVILLVIGIKMTKNGNIWGILISFLGFGFIGVIPTTIIYNDIRTGVREPSRPKSKRGDE